METLFLQKDIYNSMTTNQQGLITKYGIVAGGAGLGYFIFRNTKIGAGWGAVIGAITLAATISGLRNMGLSDSSQTLLQFWGVDNPPQVSGAQNPTSAKAT